MLAPCKYYLDQMDKGLQYVVQSKIRVRPCQTCYAVADWNFTEPRTKKPKLVFWYYSTFCLEIWRLLNDHQIPSAHE